MNNAGLHQNKLGILQLTAKTPLVVQHIQLTLNRQFPVVFAAIEQVGHLNQNCLGAGWIGQPKTSKSQEYIWPEGPDDTWNLEGLVIQSLKPPGMPVHHRLTLRNPPANVLIAQSHGDGNQVRMLRRDMSQSSYHVLPNRYSSTHPQTMGQDDYS